MAIMLELDHPNIIKLLDFFEKRDHYYMVVEKIRGTSTKLRNACMYERTRRSFVLCVCVGVTSQC